MDTTETIDPIEVETEYETGLEYGPDDVVAEVGQALIQKLNEMNGEKARISDLVEVAREPAKRADQSPTDLMNAAIDYVVAAKQAREDGPYISLIRES